MGLFSRVKEVGARQLLAYIEKNPDENILKIVDGLIKLNVAGAGHNEDLLKIRSYLSDPSSNWYRLIRSLWIDVDESIRKTIFENLVVNVGLNREDSKAAAGGELPMALMIDQNRSVGISKLPPAQGKTLDEYDMIISRGKTRGIFAYVITGGGETVSADNLRKLARVHRDCVFVYMMKAREVTSGFADMVFAAKNIVPMVDYKNAGEALRIMKARKLIFGVTAACAEGNASEIASEKFIDDAVAGGAKLAWLVEDISGIPEEASKRIYERVLACRETKEILEVDFIYEEKFVGGRVDGV